MMHGTSRFKRAFYFQFYWYRLPSWDDVWVHKFNMLGLFKHFRHQPFIVVDEQLLNMK